MNDSNRIRTNFGIESKYGPASIEHYQAVCSFVDEIHQSLEKDSWLAAGDPYAAYDSRIVRYNEEYDMTIVIDKTYSQELEPSLDSSKSVSLYYGKCPSKTFSDKEGHQGILSAVFRIWSPSENHEQDQPYVFLRGDYNSYECVDINAINSEALEEFKNIFNNSKEFDSDVVDKAIDAQWIDYR